MADERRLQTAIKRVDLQLQNLRQERWLETSCHYNVTTPRIFAKQRDVRKTIQLTSVQFVKKLVRDNQQGICCDICLF